MFYTPSQGDIILMDFHPQSGHEQTGRRPAFVISNNSFHRYTNLCIVFPITTKKTNFPLHVALGEDTKTNGVVMCEQLKSLDMQSRNAVFVERVDKSILGTVLTIVSLFFDKDKN